MRYFLSSLIIFALSGTVAYAADSPLLVLSSVLGSAGDNLPEFLNRLYNVALLLGALLAVILIIYAGVEYMISEAAAGKVNAKGHLQNALLGLLMLLVIYIFFNQINPDILDLNINIDPVTIEVGPTTQPQSNPPTTSYSDYVDQAGIVAQLCDIPGRPACAEAIGSCQRAGIYTSIRQPSPTMVECVRDSSLVSPADIENVVLDENIDYLIESGDFSEVITTYEDSNWDNLSGDERRNLAENVWPTQCEENDDGTETGYEYREIQVGTTLMRRVCVRP